MRRVGRDSDEPDREGDGNHEADSCEETPWERLARLTRLGGKVGDGLEPRVGDHREREREGDRTPRRRRPEVDALGQRVGREEEHEAEHDEQQMRGEGQPGDQDRAAVETRPPNEARYRDPEDHEDADDGVPGLVGQPLPADRVPEVVRDEERGQRHHDQVVEDQRPAGEETGLVVEGAADERRGAAGLWDRAGAFRVRQRDEEEEQADGEEHPGGEAEREQGDNSEREVERGGDLPVGDRRERRNVEDALEAWKLPSHGVCASRPEARRRG